MRGKSIIAIVLTSLVLAVPVQADSRRIEVYELSQHYVDVKDGDTLGEIAAALLPYGSPMRQQLMQDIVQMNPGAFPGGRAERMLSGARLFLPNSVQPAQQGKAGNYSVESFNWGHIKRPR